MNYSILAAAASACVLSSSASADLITWGTPLDTTSLSEVSTNGSLVVAHNLAGPGSPDVVLNGVTFTQLVPNEWDSGGSSLMSLSTTGDTDFDDFLRTARTTFGTPSGNPTGYGAIRLDTLGTMELGKTYEVQVWYCDQRSGALRDRIMNLSSTVGGVITNGGIATNLATLGQGAISGDVDADPNDLNGAGDTVFGQYCIGTLTRSSADPLWLLVEGSHPSAGQNLRPHVTGFQLREVNIGDSYCAAALNSTGTTAKISASGSSIASLNDLTIEVTDMPPLAFGFFLTSTTQGFVMNPGGSAGNLCLGGAIGRSVGPGQIQNSGTAGEISLELDLTQHPTPGGLVTVVAGDTWNFSAWFRDTDAGGQPTSNFCNGVELTFQ